MHKRIWVSLIVFIFLSPGLSQAQKFAQVEIKTVPVQGSVYMLVGRGGNIGVSAGEDGILLIDDQFAPLIPKIKEALKKINAKAVKFVVNTHFHPDHTGGNEPLGKGGTVIVAHDNVRKRLGTEQFNKFLKRKTPPSPPAALPIITFSKDITFHFNGDTLKVFHVDPAHTDGDALVYFTKANAIHMGDTYFAGMYPYIDTGSGGKINGMIAAMDRVLKEIPANAKVIPGHGPLSNMGELKQYRNMLVAVRDRVQKLKSKGKSLQEVVAAKPTANFDNTWAKGFLKPDRFVTIVYESLK